MLGSVVRLLAGFSSKALHTSPQYVDLSTLSFFAAVDRMLFPGKYRWKSSAFPANAFNNRWRSCSMMSSTGVCQAVGSIGRKLALQVHDLRHGVR